jgi:glycosyltransferase involved in cell wall biosynthesis
VRLIYNGVPDVQPPPVARVAPGPTIGSLGRLSFEKGHDILLRAVAELPDVAAVLVGDGPDRERLVALASELGIAERVTFAGWQAEPMAWLPGLDVFVLPSRLEALGLAAIEAMLARRPVVGSDTGGLPEVVVEGETGLLVAPEDPGALATTIAGLLSDPARRAAMGERGREVALSRFGVDRMVREYEAVYEELLAGR